MQEVRETIISATSAPDSISELNEPSGPSTAVSFNMKLWQCS